MIGSEAKQNFDIANALVKAGQFEAARKVELMPSDRKLIEARIVARIVAARANSTKERT